MNSANHLSRASFIRDDLRGHSAPVRPPWAVAESLFDDACYNCGKCIEACTENILALDEASYPRLILTKGNALFVAIASIVVRPLLIHEQQRDALGFDCRHWRSMFG